MKKCKTFFCLVSIMSCSTLFVPRLFGSCFRSHKKCLKYLTLQDCIDGSMGWWIQVPTTIHCLSGYLSPEWCVPGYHIAVYLLIPHPFDIYGATIGIIPSHKYFSWLPIPNGMTLINFLNLIKLFLYNSQV